MRSRKIISSLIISGIIVTSLTSFHYSKHKSVNKILLAEPITTSSTINANNFTQKLVNGYSYNNIVQQQNITTAEAIVDTYTEVFGKEGALNKEVKKQIYNDYIGYPQLANATKPVLWATLYLVGKGIMTIPNNFSSILNAPIPDSLATSIYERTVNPNQRITPEVPDTVTANSQQYYKNSLKVTSSTIQPAYKDTVYLAGKEVGNNYVGPKGFNNFIGWKPPTNNIMLLTGGGGAKQPALNGLGTPLQQIMSNNILSGNNTGNGANATSSNNNNTNKVQNANNPNDLDTAALSASAGNVANTYTITRVFDTQNGVVDYYYMGKPLQAGKLNGGGMQSCTQDSTTKDYTAVFTVVANSSQAAIADINALTSYKDRNGSIQYTYIPALTRITSGNQTTTYVPQASIRALSTNLQILDGKYLENTVTGAKAVLLTDQNEALVGSQVMHLQSPICLTVGNTLYYNLDVVDKLMSNGYLLNLSGNNTIFTAGTTDSQAQLSNYKGDSNAVYSKGLTNQATYKVVSKSTGDVIQNALVSKVTGIMEFDENGQPTKTYNNKPQLVMNLSQLTRATDKLIFTIPIGDGKTAEVLVNFSLQIPTEVTKKMKNFTLDNINSLYYNKPSGTTLSNWWASNLDTDNALANFAYGTSGESYFACGYIVPQVTILGIKKQSQNTLLKAMGITDPNNIFHNVSNNKDAILTQARTVVSYPLSYQSPNGWNQYGPNYLMTPSGNLYEILQPVNATSKESMISDPDIVKINTAKKEIEMITRTKGTGTTFNKSQLKAGDIVNFNGHQFVYAGMYKDNADNNKQYYKLVSLSAVVGTLSSDDKFQFLKGNYSSYADYIEKTFLNGNMNQFFDGSLRILPGYPVDLPITKTSTDVKDMMWVWDDGTIYKGSSLVSSGVTVGDNCTESTKAKPTYTKSNLPKKFTDKVASYPVIYASPSNYIITKRTNTAGVDQIMLVPQDDNNLNVTRLPNLFLRGVNQGVIDSIVGHALGFKSIGNIPFNATVHIGDLTFSDVGGQLVSTPTKLNDNGWNTTIAKNPSNFIAKMFAGITVQNSVGKSSQFYNYITKASLGGLTYSQDYSQYKGNILMQQSGQPLIMIQESKAESQEASYNPYSNVSMQHKFEAYNNQKVNYSIIQIAVSPSLRFQQIGPNDYTLVCYTNMMGPGILTKSSLFQSLAGPVPFFFESWGNNLFHPLSNADTLRQAWLQKVHQKWLINVFLFLRVLFVDGITTIMMLTLLVFILQKVDFFDEMVHDLKYGGQEQGRRGFDLWKWMSFGILTVDDKLPYYKFFMIQGFLFLLLYLTFNMAGATMFYAPL